MAKGHRTGAVVAHAHDPRDAIEAHVDDNLVRLTVPDGVGDGLADDVADGLCQGPID